MLLSLEQFNELIIYIDASIDYKITEHENEHHDCEHDLGRLEAEMLREYDKLYGLIVETPNV